MSEAEAWVMIPKLDKGKTRCVLDMFPLVLCKDCKHGKYEEWDNGECIETTVSCAGYGIHRPEWYCADGEEKEKDE